MTVAIQLIRIDDRLIHGQVVISWAGELQSNEIILGDNSISENEWERELYLSIVPTTIKADVMNVKNLATFISNYENDSRKTIILVAAPQVIEKILDYDVQIEKVNVGGIHYREGRQQYLNYLYLDDQEIASFKRCMKRGVRFECLDVPHGKKVPLENLV
ncbi:MAG: hypothetical protein GF313_06940 [Caldithrix sp.]|nr:hypothetical protein [Caldithrix sp.]